MPIEITYKTSESISINNIQLNWGSARDKNRDRLNNKHKAADLFIEEIQMQQNRDIYENYLNLENYFFLNYDNNNLLQDAEIHNGASIKISSCQFNMYDDVSNVLDKLKLISDNIKILTEGEYFFPDLKLTVSNAEAMGGEGNSLSYFYCSDNIDHLLS